MIKKTDSHDLVNAHSKELTENKNTFQKDVIINRFVSETSLDLFSKAQVKRAHDSITLKDD